VKGVAAALSVRAQRCQSHYFSATLVSHILELHIMHSSSPLNIIYVTLFLISRKITGLILKML
jgi:hypothetical protein